jgi:hypothetical protein
MSDEGQPPTPSAENVSRIREERIAQREKLRQKLEGEGRKDLASRIGKCGKPMTIRCIDCQEPRHVFTRCDLKWCPACQHALAARTCDRYSRIMAKIEWPLRVTMTAKNWSYDDPNAMRDLRRAWGKMRRLRWFRRSVKGGVVSFEITDKGRGIHAHAHGLFDCRWLSVKEGQPRFGCSQEEWRKKAKAAAAEVGEQWALCCGRPASIQVRRVWVKDGGDIAPALRETLKYSVKGSDLLAVATKAGRVIDQLDGTRLITSFGTCFGLPEFRRIKPVPAMCQCGCSQWLPEEVMEMHVKRDAAKYR